MCETSAQTQGEEELYLQETVATAAVDDARSVLQVDTVPMLDRPASASDVLYAEPIPPPPSEPPPPPTEPPQALRRRSSTRSERRSSIGSEAETPGGTRKSARILEREARLSGIGA